LRIRINEAIKNITEIQEPRWASQLSDDDLDYIEKNFFFVFQIENHTPFY